MLSIGKSMLDKTQSKDKRGKNNSHCMPKSSEEKDIIDYLNREILI